MDPIDGTRWCPRDVAIKKTWRYCLDCGARRNAKRCPYMWLYWERKKIPESEPPPLLETYERVCGKCDAKLSLHHALLHLLNAAGFRTVAVEFEHKRQIAHFENCPHCFAGVGWFPGKPIPEVELSPEEAMVVEHTQRIAEAIAKSPDDDALARRRRIDRSISKTGEVDASFVGYLEYDHAEIRRKEETPNEASQPVLRRKTLNDYEIVYPAQDLSTPRKDSENDIGQAEAGLRQRKPSVSAGSNDNIESLWTTLYPDSSFPSNSENEVVSNVAELPIYVDPRIDGVPRCPNHDYRNGDRDCPFCHRSLCRDCMAFVRGIYGCRDCFSDFKIRNMYDIPRNWESEKSIELGPAPVTDGLAWFGLVRIAYEGALATPRHRFFAHLIDMLIAAILWLPLMYLFLRLPVTVQDQVRDTLIGWIPSRFVDVIPPDLVIFLGGLFAMTWLMVAVVAFFRSRSPGQQVTNLVVVTEDGCAPGFPILLLRAIYALFGVLSLGVLTAISYGTGPATGISQLDWLGGYRVVTYSGMRAVHRDERVLRVAAVAPSQFNPDGASNEELDEIRR